ncbi:MAG: hypothetical protein LDL33_01930 [Desulfomonile sp.]|nr:hypothetical protein [Desulfomonile sp.]
MTRFKRLLGEPGFHLLVFILSFFVFGWPFVTVPSEWSPSTIFYSLFATWFGFIVVLFLIARD